MSTLRSFTVGALALLTLSTSCSRRERSVNGEPNLLSDSPVDASAPESCQDVRCSSDLRQVLDSCTGRVITECPPDQGCGGGACVPACDAARLSQGSIGCDFFTLPPDDDTVDGLPGSCFAAFVANTWEQPVTISAEYGGEVLDISMAIYLAPSRTPSGASGLIPLHDPLAPGQVAIVLLSAADLVDRRGNVVPGCPAPVAVNYDPIRHGTGLTKAFRIKTDRPVSAYSIYPFAGSSSWVPSATLLLPVPSWTTNYLAVSPWQGQYGTVNGFLLPPTYPFVQIIASENDTEVRIRPTIGIAAGTQVDEVVAGETRSWKLAAGEVLQLTQFNELTGSAIESDKPIGLFGGHQCSFLPTDDTGYSDILDQQIPPLSHWGSEYAFVPSIPRRGTAELVPYRVVAAVDGTVLSYDAADAPPADAPRELAAGQAATFMSRHPMIVRSQDTAHPFYAAVYMTGSSYQAHYGDDSYGDPDFVNLVSSQQYLDRYVFYMDYTYSESSITVVRRKGMNGFAPIVLDCAGELDEFRPLGTTGEYEYTHVLLTHGFIDQTFADGKCGSGRHEAKSVEPFALYVWGTASYASYGYPGGTGLRPATPVKVEIPR